MKRRSWKENAGAVTGPTLLKLQTCFLVLWLKAWTLPSLRESWCPQSSDGAESSRLNFSADLLVNNRTNLEAANSRIIDVDVAQESTQLARYSILVQAGTAMLAQANASSQVALRLLS